MSGVIIYLASPPPCGVNEGQLIGDLCGPLRRWRWLPWLQARGASCASINGGMCGGVGGGLQPSGGFQRQQLALKTEAAHLEQLAGLSLCRASLEQRKHSWNSGWRPPPRAGTAVYFKLMLTPRSRSSINCEQFNQSVSSCLKIFE